MKKSKQNVILDYDNLDTELIKQVGHAYPFGFNNAFIEYTNKNKLKVKAIRLETNEKIYLLRLSKENVVQLLKED